MADLARRTGLPTAHLEALATADAFAGFGLIAPRGAVGGGRGRAGQTGPPAGHGRPAPTRRRCPAWTTVDRLVADVWATGLSPGRAPGAVHPGRSWTAAGAVPIAAAGPGRGTAPRVRVGGIVTHRQRPATAGGVTFVNLEDETGMLNVTCSPGLWQRYRRVARTSAALVVRGRLEKAEGVLNLVADRLEAVTPPISPASRDFR